MKHQSSEMIMFMQTWIIVYILLTYSFFLGKFVPPGRARFFLVLPVVAIFLILPFRLATIHLGALTFFFIAWLANFKLLLFSFNKGPLIFSSSSASLHRFIAAASLPIEITPNSNFDDNPPPKTSSSSPISKGFAIKALMMAMVVKLFDFKSRLNPTAILFLCGFLIYFSIDFLLALPGAAARAGLGLQLEPQFNKPYRASSLKNFWGRRWNLVVTNTFRLAVYQPVMGLLNGPLGQRTAQQVAVLTTFGVSAVVHEILMYCLTRMHPTGRTSAFFLLNGVCVVAETAFVRRYRHKLHVPRIVSSMLTIWFVVSTALWLFFPEFLRGKLVVRGFQEYAAFGEFINGVFNGTVFRSFDGMVSVQHFLREVTCFRLPQKL